MLKIQYLLFISPSFVIPQTDTFIFDELQMMSYGKILLDIIFYQKHFYHLVYFLNSYENDTVEICSNLISGKYPVLNDEIFVYALCEKTLSEMISNKDDDTNVYNSVKPIFLLLHVPKNKEKNVILNIIIFQIYLHLSLICDLEIIILNKENYDEQIQFALQIDAFKNHNKKEPYIISHDANSYIENDYSYFEAESIFHYDSDDDDSSSDEYKKEYSDDQDNDINDEFNSFDKYNAVDSNIIYRNTKRFYFVKGPSYENDTETFNF